MIGRLAILVLVVASGCSGIPGDRTAEQALQDFVEAANSGDIDGALELMADEAVWAQDDFEFPLRERLGEEFGWLTEGLGLEADATFEDVLAVFLRAESDIGTERTVTSCRGDDSSITCAYVAADVLTAISGVAETGILMVQASHDQITRWETHADTPGEPVPAWDHFRRWIRLEDSRFDMGGLPLIDAAALERLVTAWEAAGRPDIPRPTTSDDPIAVVETLLAVWAAGDWAGWVGLLAGDALEAAIGTWDSFQAAGLLERVVSPGECEITLESGRIGAAVACQVTVHDIILDTARIEGVQWNATTFHVKDGRVTTLPVFIPSSATAERRIEEWAVAAHPDAYAASCPDGIVDPTGVERLPCARFIVDHRQEWAPLVAAILGNS